MCKENGQTTDTIEETGFVLIYPVTRNPSGP
jgi:hypothetical protein